jgi:hypothetical protein
MIAALRANVSHPWCGLDVDLCCPCRDYWLMLYEKRCIGMQEGRIRDRKFVSLLSVKGNKTNFNETVSIVRRHGIQLGDAKYVREQCALRAR